ncbi:MAG TPA: cell division protein ZipA [Legionella sp.]|nr:cell division protein ZipA [Legionella sp.]
MQANWSLVLNILLLIVVVVAIARMIKERRKNTYIPPVVPSMGEVDQKKYDDIIAVRKVEQNTPSVLSTVPQVLEPVARPMISPANLSEAPVKPIVDHNGSTPILLVLLAKENRQFAGYELLQTLLSAGLRFGEGQLFHRHQYPNGQGPVLCSLAAATPSGMFDLQNMGAFNVRGLCLFMQASGNPTIDAERFEIMLDTAKQLSEGLDAHLLDDKRRPFSDASLQRYYRQLNIADVCDVALEKTA